ncbi:serine hydrolase domain-containing protein [Marinobacterium arenosum]|uniref:serine hydrolase domain-containing protein n=1 Tax=Marinobacterium arenosum TaxID=2862496 RepID=UPI001C93909D|nr:serine hydrolase domain-containing protein [Marinobacterium arenosum]MBY4675473.1 beta-lactamase family protein [Marinobacterium arenosum]
MLASIPLPFLTICALLTLCLAPPGRAADKPLAERLAQELTALLQKQQPRPFNGVLLIARNDQHIFQYRQGLADRQRQIPVSVEQRFGLGSLSKQITAALTLRAVEQGLLALDEPIRHYLPTLDKNGSEHITAGQLLNHTSGLKRPGQPPVFQPGSNFAYSNYGYNLLGQLLTKVTGREFADLAAELFQQCGMSSATVGFDTSRTPAFIPAAIGYHESAAYQLARADWQPPADAYPSGGLSGTAGDLHRWNRCLHQGKLLSDRSYAQMTQATAKRRHRWGELGYGFALQIDHPAGVLEYSHSGYVPSYIATMSYYPESQTSLILLENVSWAPDDMSRVFFHHDRVRDKLVTELADRSL